MHNVGTTGQCTIAMQHQNQHEKNISQKQIGLAKLTLKANWNFTPAKMRQFTIFRKYAFTCFLD